MGIRLPYKQNLHTHTTYCDGMHTPEQMIRYAIAQGFDSLGFSAHSYMSYSDSLKVTPDSTREYKKEINRLKCLYRDRIKIYLGMEFDVFSSDDTSGLDYCIGGVHTIRGRDGSLYEFDGRESVFRNAIDVASGGDGMEFARRYYEAVSELPLCGRFDIVAHFDLVTKHRGRVKFFDDESEEYRAMAREAVRKIAPHIPYFEVNVGAVSRGYRTEPYPAPFIMREMLDCGMGAVIGTDCHNGELLDSNIEDGIRHLHSVGCDTIHILTDDGFIPIKA